MQVKKLLGTSALVVVLALTLTACNKKSTSTNATANESKIQQHGYTQLATAQPAHSMDYSPTRDTINGWIDTWGKRGQLAFVYIRNDAGAPIGYYVLQGPPVTYCAALTPNYKLINPSNNDSNGPDIPVPAPSIDGVYYSGGQCSEYIGKDATTDNIFDFTVGLGQSFISTTQPLYLSDPTIKPLGITAVSDLHKDANGKYVK